MAKKTRVGTASAGCETVLDRPQTKSFVSGQIKDWWMNSSAAYSKSLDEASLIESFVPTPIALAESRRLNKSDVAAFDARSYEFFRQDTQHGQAHRPIEKKSIGFAVP